MSGSTQDEDATQAKKKRGFWGRLFGGKDSNSKDSDPNQKAKNPKPNQ